MDDGSPTEVYTFDEASIHRIIKQLLYEERSPRNINRWRPTYRHRVVGTGGVGGPASPTGNIILIDFDFEKIDEADPRVTLTDADVGTGNGTGTPYQILYQDPADSDYGTHLFSNLNLWSFRANKVAVKYYRANSSIINSGTAGTGDINSLVLGTGASIVDSFYDDDSVSISGQSKTIGDYAGGTRLATVDEDFDPPITFPAAYSITSDRNYILATTAVTNDAHNPPQKIARYQVRNVWYFAGEAAGFTRDLYTLQEFRAAGLDYPENETFNEDSDPDGDWGPTGSQTYKKMDREYFKKRYRAGTNYRLGREFIDFQTCEELPPPELIENE